MTAFRAIIDAGEQLGRWEQTLSSLGIREPEESALGEAFAGVDVTVNVLVDDNDRVRRVDDEISVQQLMEAAIISGAMPPEFVGDARRFKGIITNTVEFSDFGVAVSVTAPAVDETIDVDEAVQRSQTI